MTHAKTSGVGETHNLSEFAIPRHLRATDDTQVPDSPNTSVRQHPQQTEGVRPGYRRQADPEEQSRRRALRRSHESQMKREPSRSHGKRGSDPLPRADAGWAAFASERPASGDERVVNTHGVEGSPQSASKSTPSVPEKSSECRWSMHIAHVR
eukprot:1344719-Rhodomonas_salina.5